VENGDNCVDQFHILLDLYRRMLYHLPANLHIGLEFLVYEVPLLKHPQRQ